jgi:hypothetical protein
VSVSVKRQSKKSRESRQKLSDFAKFQITDPFEDIDNLAWNLRAERAGWKEPIADDLVTLKISNTVSASFSTRALAAAFVDGFNNVLSTSPGNDSFESSIRELMNRRPDLSKIAARTTRLKLHANAVHVHAWEASRAFEKLLPDLLSLASRLPSPQQSRLRRKRRADINLRTS